MMLVLTALLALMCAYGGQCCPVCPTIDIHTELKELRTWLEDLTHRLSTTQRELEQERAGRLVFQMCLNTICL